VAHLCRSRRATSRLQLREDRTRRGRRAISHSPVDNHNQPKGTWPGCSIRAAASGYLLVADAGEALLLADIGLRRRALVFYRNMTRYP